nr:hypothetical protein [Tanacetum cinerariifolium]
MTCPTLDPVNRVTRNNDNPNDSPSLQDHILDHMSSLKALIKRHYERSGTLVEPIRLTFGDEEVVKARTDGKGIKEKEEEDLQKPYKEVIKSPFTRRIIKFSAPSHSMPTNLKIYDGSTDPDDHVTRFVGAANQGESQMSVWCRMFQQTLDGLTRDWFGQLPNGCINNWTDLQERISKAVLRPSPQDNEMMKGVDDFVKSEEAFKSTELPRGEFSKKGQGTSYRGSRPPRAAYGGRKHQTDKYNNFNRRYHYQPYVHPQTGNKMYDNNHLSLDSLIKQPKEILATKLQLQLPPGPPNSNPDRVGRLLWREKLIPKGKVELEVTFSDGFCQKTMMKFTMSEKKKVEQEEKREEAEPEEQGESEEEKVLINLAFLKQKVTIGTKFSKEWQLQLINLLKNNLDVFAWQPPDMTGVHKWTIKHSLNVNLSIPPVAQKRRVLGTEKSQAVMKEVEEWVKADIVRPVKYPTWISNPVLMTKKMAFYTDQGTYCYTKMPSGNANATYQRLVDSAFQTQLGRNLEAYVDDMVIKRKTEQGMIMDIAETFDNLQKINMKLNPKKCSFGMGKGKFLGYMVTSEKIRANPKKTKAMANMQSPKILKEMQSLSGKLAALNRFLSRSVERALPFFKTLKNIIKLINELPTLTTPLPKEILYLYLVAS